MKYFDMDLIWLNCDEIKILFIKSEQKYLVFNEVIVIYVESKVFCDEENT